MNLSDTISFALGGAGLALSFYVGFTNKRFRLAGAAGGVIAVTSLLGTYSSWAFDQAGKWLPSPPEVKRWSATETPLQPGILAMLGNPQGIGCEYRNPFGEPVYYTLVTAGPFENYHDPTVCIPQNGFTLTAKREFPLGGTDVTKGPNVRAMIFTHVTGAKMMMYYWTQTRTGETATAARMGTYRDIGPRFQTGYAAVIKRDQTVIVRIYAQIAPDDQNGEQAQRNLNEIARATYLTLRKAGKAKG